MENFVKKRNKSDDVAPYIAVDLDGTLAYYDEFKGLTHIGEPIQPMVERVQKMLMQGWQVKIFTARAAHTNPTEKMQMIDAIEQWCIKYIGRALPVTCIKDYGMVTLFDDRAVQVEKNTGRIIGGE